MRDLMSWDQAEHLLGESVLDKEDRKIGKVEDLANAWDKMVPEWLVIRTSLFGRPRLVPIDAVDEKDNTIHVPYSKETVLSAPVPEAPTTIYRSDREALDRHYARAA
jgi:sporulation protein YlmC with PRC-barrel domain